MLFNSLEFVVFFPLVVGVYFALPLRFRWAFLLAASYFFYGRWRWEYLVLLVLTTVVDWWVALRMEDAATRGRRRGWLWLSLVCNLGVLFIFKYYNFFNGALRSLVTWDGGVHQAPDLAFLLPVGISFYTFQSLAYTIDVYRGTQKAERHLGFFALYVAYFPQLVAGPIERSGKLLPQLRLPARVDLDRWADGLTRMAWGFFKKLVIADRLALYVEPVYGNPGAHGGWATLIATYCFAFQIYCDFSGYSDIAIGAARVMDVRLMENFRAPYAARSVPEFWRRWHISLTTWFRDYVYAGLGSNRRGKVRWHLNILFIFLLSGLWHGANWTFVVTGLLHGGYMVGSAMTREVRGRVRTRLGVRPGGDAWRDRVHGLFALLFTFHLILLAWVFFRAPSLSGALTLLGTFTDPGGGLIEALHLGPGAYQLAIAAAALAAMFWLERDGARPERVLRPAARPVWVRWGYAYALVFGILMFGQFSMTEFIYFQF